MEETNLKSPFTVDILKAMQACSDHATDLLDAATILQASKRPNIAYHLAALGLEELGRRELIGFQAISAATRRVPPSWPLRHSQDHIQKMFWAFFGAMFRSQKITRNGFEELRSFAKNIHSRRIAGLYVDTSDGLHIPGEAIPSEEAQDLIALLEARLGMVASEDHRSDATQEDIDLQNWFLTATENEIRRKYIFSENSMSKLAEVSDARRWIEWLKYEFDAADAQAMMIVKRDLEKTPVDQPSAKPKWKLRLRIFADAHSIRPKALNWWNERVTWIKLLPVSNSKKEIIAEITFNDDVHIERLWLAGWIVARRFVAALNLGTRGLWWWHLPRQISRYYERIEDIENGLEVNLERSPALKVAWGPNLLLDEDALRQTMIHLTVVMRLVGSEAEPAIEYYLGGLTFLSLNEIHWQCEAQAFGNFHQCIKIAMKVFQGWNGVEPFEDALSRFLSDAAPAMPAEQRSRYVTIARAYEADAPQQVRVDLSDVGLIKVLCDTYFASAVAPAVLKDAEVRVVAG